MTNVRHLVQVLRQNKAPTENPYIIWLCSIKTPGKRFDLIVLGIVGRNNVTSKTQRKLLTTAPA